jgi:ATP-dependent RNA helicase DDX60
MFEMLLMSPYYRDWVSRLRYVILDEVHCIGEGDDEGRAWERLIQLIPCPFIALSATVANPYSFHHWLSIAHKSNTEQSLQIPKKKNVNLIFFNERYADLNYYIFGRTDDSSVERNILSLNPIICLTYSQVMIDGITQTFYLPSGDLLNVISLTLCFLFECF